MDYLTSIQKINDKIRGLPLNLDGRSISDLAKTLHSLNIAFNRSSKDDQALIETTRQSIAERLAPIADNLERFIYSPTGDKSMGLSALFSALFALVEYKKDSFDGATMARIITELAEAEAEEGGPYFSYFPDQENSLPKDIELLPNIFISLFLSKFDVELDSLKILLGRPSDDIETNYWLALLDPQKAGAISGLIEKILADRHDGLWPSALALEITSRERVAPTASRSSVDEQTAINRQAVLDEFDERLSAITPGLAQMVRLVSDKILAIDKDSQILLMPYFTARALQVDIDPVLIKKVGTANLLMWTAYTIYDDFQDDEGRPPLLSAANFCLRDAITTISSLLPGNNDFQSFFQAKMNMIDAANLAEVSRQRAKIENGVLQMPETLPFTTDWRSLADKSIAHAWGSVIILFARGFSMQSDEVSAMTRFYEYYLAARQLNDDAHDWEKDLRSGHITAVVAEVLRPYQGNKELKIDDEIRSIKESFWLDLIKKLSHEMLALTAEAEKILDNMAIIKDRSFFTGLLEPIKKSATKALREQKEFTKFIDSMAEMEKK